jgi:hypothetical protein
MMIPIFAWSWNIFGWHGNLEGQAAKVLNACEQAVKLNSEYGRYRDSRGLARALTGNIEGAIEDFQASVNWLDDWWQKAQRQGWIDKLRKGGAAVHTGGAGGAEITTGIRDKQELEKESSFYPDFCFIS